MILGIERAAVNINQLCVRNYACWTGFSRKKTCIWLYFVFCTQYRKIVRKLTTSGNGWCIGYFHLHLFFRIHAVYPTFCFLYFNNNKLSPFNCAQHLQHIMMADDGMLLRSIMHLHYCRFYIIVDYNWMGDICWPEQGNWSIWSSGVIISEIRCSGGQCQWTEEAGIGHPGQGNSYTDQYEIACEPSHHQWDKIHDYRLNDLMGGRGSQRCRSYSEPPLSC